MRAALFVILSTVMFSACTSAPPPPPYRPVADLKTLMQTVMEPAAEVYWDSVGIIVDHTGEHQIEPITTEDWDAVRNAAFVVAESGNLLMMPTRAQDPIVEKQIPCGNCHIIFCPDAARIILVCDGRRADAQSSPIFHAASSRKPGAPQRKEQPN